MSFYADNYAVFLTGMSDLKFRKGKTFFSGISLSLKIHTHLHTYTDVSILYDICFDFCCQRSKLEYLYIMKCFMKAFMTVAKYDIAFFPQFFFCCCCLGFFCLVLTQIKSKSKQKNVNAWNDLKQESCRFF